METEMKICCYFNQFQTIHDLSRTQKKRFLAESVVAGNSINSSQWLPTLQPY